MFLLGYDIGSSSVKASLVDAGTGKCVASAFFPKTEAGIIAVRSGWAEQEPEDWWENLKLSTQSVLSESGIAAGDIKAIGISYQMHGLVCVDRQQRVLRPAIIWCDSRAVPYGQKAFETIGEEFCLAHLLNSPGNFTASKLAWIKENEPHIYAQIDKIMLPGDYIAMKLSGEICTTVEGLSEGMLWDFRNDRKADFLMQYYGFDSSLIADIRPTFAEQERRVPLNTRGQSLLAGNVFCGHCGSRLALTTNGKAYPCKEDAHRIVKRVRYICYGKTRKQTECDGQTGYTAHILDGIIDKVVRQIFERMKAIPKSEIVNIRYREKMEERKALLKSAKSDYAKAAAELDTLRAEVIKSLRGESAFSQDLLGSLISDCETKCLEVQHTMEAAQAAYDEGQAMLDALNAQYDDIISWADMYDSASTESKKMIVSCLIRRVEVYRDYRLHIDFNIDFEQFSAGLDISAIAA